MLVLRILLQQMCNLEICHAWTDGLKRALVPMMIYTVTTSFYIKVQQNLVTCEPGGVWYLPVCFVKCSGVDLARKEQCPYYFELHNSEYYENMKVQNAPAPFAEQKPSEVMMESWENTLETITYRATTDCIQKIVLNLEMFLKRSQQLWILCASECINLCSGPWRDSKCPIFSPNHIWPMIYTIWELADFVRNGTSKRAGVSSFNDVFGALWFFCEQL